jgi:peptidoglycan DL-endopeptidase CwlO
MQYRGVPYRYGGTSPAGGFDCSGLVQYVYAHFGVVLPRTSSAQATSGVAVSAANATAGDLVFFWSGSHVYHVGIYLGGGQMLAAPKPGDHVKVEPIYTTSVTYRRVL